MSERIGTLECPGTSAVPGHSRLRHFGSEEKRLLDSMRLEFDDLARRYGAALQAVLTP
jgi:hypothetical protein